MVLEIPTNPKILQIEITGEADFSYRIIPVRGKTYLRVYNGDTNPFTFDRPSGTGKWTKLAILVAGGATGGNYTIAIKDPLNGIWSDNFGYTWIVENGNMSSLYPLGKGGDCGTYTGGMQYNPCSQDNQVSIGGFQPTYFPDCLYSTPDENWCMVFPFESARLTSHCQIIGKNVGSSSGCNGADAECIPGPMCCMQDYEDRNITWTFIKHDCP